MKKRIKAHDLVNKGYRGLAGDMLITNISYLERKLSKAKTMLSIAMMEPRCSGCDMSKASRAINKAVTEVDSLLDFTKQTRNRRTIVGDITEE